MNPDIGTGCESKTTHCDRYRSAFFRDPVPIYWRVLAVRSTRPRCGLPDLCHGVSRHFHRSAPVLVAGHLGFWFDGGFCQSGGTEPDGAEQPIGGDFDRRANGASFPSMRVRCGATDAAPLSKGRAAMCWSSFSAGCTSHQPGGHRQHVCRIWLGADVPGPLCIHAAHCSDRWFDL